LTGEIKDTNGNDVRVVRHNGIVETNHRWSRMHARRRTGRNRTTNDMAKYGALTAVLSNLENKFYVENVMGDVSDFIYELQSIGWEELEEAKKLIKPHRNEFLISSDSERVSLLHEFVTILEHTDEKDKIDVNKWLIKLE
jgi:DNA-binding PadR family transcriptional regulator